MSAWDWTAWSVGSLILGAVLIAVTLLALVLAAWAVTLAATRSRRNPDSPFPRQSVRAPRSVWRMRWARFLRHALRQHHVIGGERSRIERMGIGAFLWADDVRREVAS